MHCLRLVNEMHNGELSGAELYSSDISLRPSDPTILLDKQAVREFAVDTKTAASVCLLMQIALPVMLFLPSPALLTLKGEICLDLLSISSWVLSMYVLAYL
jgi:RNA 3'-terminal phosphate cyclase